MHMFNHKRFTIRAEIYVYTIKTNKLYSANMLYSAVI